MNLNGIVAPITAAVTPQVLLTVLISAGTYVMGDDGARTPQYLPPQQVYGSIQPMTYRDLIQVEGLNLNGTRRSIYLNGQIRGIVRDVQKGGDLVRTPNGEEWLVALVIESWPDWCKVAATLQRIIPRSEIASPLG